MSLTRSLDPRRTSMLIAEGVREGVQQMHRADIVLTLSSCRMISQLAYTIRS